MTKVLKITPKISELTPSTDKKIVCPEINCESTFQNSSRLNFHLKNHHKKVVQPEVNHKNFIKNFHCPVSECIYHENSTNYRFFTCLKYLRQHFLKVHAEKSIKCDNCDRCFLNENLKLNHQKHCGLKFSCNECGWEYNSKEALQTHGKRKNHKIYTEIQPIVTKPRAQLILPKPEFKILIKIGKTTNDQSIQTDEQIKSLPKKKERKRTSQTQTVVNSKKLKTTSETSVDTTDNFTLTFDELSGWKNNSSTQTNFNLFEESDSNLIDNSSQTQNNLNNMNYFEDSLSCFGTSGFDAGLCSIETQTDVDHLFHNSSDSTNLDQILEKYSHMHTQTCDEILSELGLTDIQTQTNLTNYNELLVSTETQTSFSQHFLGNSSIQTQTSTSIELLTDIN